MNKKPRIAIYYENRLRNDGPPLYWLNVLKNQLNLDVTHLLPIGDTRSFGTFDYHFWIDFGEDSFSKEMSEWQIPKDGGKTIYVASDTHLDNGYRFKRAQQFDYVFFNQLRAVKEYGTPKKGQHVYISWLPHAAEPEAYPHTVQAKKFDVCFIGHVQETKNLNDMTRIESLHRLFQEFPNFYFGTRSPIDPSKNMFEDAARKFNQSKVVFNISIKDDINMRFFETLVAGGFLLTNSLPTLKDLEKQYGFIEGGHYATYDTYDELLELTRYYVEHDEERENIAKAGHEQALKTGTYLSRVESVLRIIGYPTSL